MLFASPGIDTAAPKATRIDLFSAATPQMRAFHVTWLAFFVCFFAWFAAAPLMPLIKTEFGLSKDQIANINIAAVAVTILVRLVVGPLCDRFGPETYVSALDALLRQTDANLGRGFRAIKMKVGRPDLRDDAERVAAMRAHLGAAFPLMVDANMAWTADGAIRAARAFAPHDPLWLEEPTIPEDVAGHASIGLANVDARLRAVYGDEHGLVVETAPGAGTKVTVRVPKFSPRVRAAS